MRFFFLVTGTRRPELRDHNVITGSLFLALEQARAAGYSSIHMALIHGTCAGVDLLAEKWALEHGIQPIGMPAIWGHNSYQAGPIRNRNMVHVLQRLIMTPLGQDTSNHMCLAFPRGESKGTRGCIELIHKAGLNLRVHEI